MTSNPQSRPISPRLDAALATAHRHVADVRAGYAEIPVVTRRRFAAFAVVVIGVFFAVEAAQEMFEVYRRAIGPVVWDAAHGQRDAITTVSAGIVAVVVFVLVARLFARAAADLRRGRPSSALSGPRPHRDGSAQ